MEKGEQVTSSKQEPDVITIEPTEETQREKEVREVTDKARAQALERLQQTTRLTDYLRWHSAASVYFTPACVDWIWDYGGTTPEELVTEQKTERFTQGYVKNTAVAEAMKPMVDTLEPKESMVRVALKRVRDHGGIYTYRVLAAFPEGTRISDPLDGVSKDGEEATGINVVFFEPENACVKHACDDLYKANRDTAFYMPYKGLGEAIGQLQTNRKGVNEYLLEKTEAGNITQDAQNYILVGLLGGYSNERFRVRISDFWNKASQQVQSK